ncbi:hypothetical protein AB1Y20_021854 [Prymnesium parvum]|uniref:Hexosyltransferase n=1 Tax=Prymnesium parvum TaxID=97485 RepID=A0AB34JNE6_PRYPA
MPHFCAGGDKSPHFAVLGVLTFEDRLAYRSQIRANWMTPSAVARSGILSRFVLRGVGASAAIEREAEAHGDMVFVHAPNALKRTIGPLVSFVRWLECSVVAWPNAQHIGKADDDVWLHLSSIASVMAASLASLAASSSDGTPPRLMWGHMETYSWDIAAGRPTRHGYTFFKGHDCKQRRVRREEILAKSLAHANQTPCIAGRDERGVLRCGGGEKTNVLGPFGFPKGPVFFTSASLVSQLVASVPLRQETARIIQSVNNSRKEAIKPWEDVYLGMGLARTAVGDGIALVHIGCATYTDEWGFYMSPSTLVWHMRTKVPERIGEAEVWAQQHHCTPVVVGSRCSPQPWSSCTGAKWRRCILRYNKTACSDQLYTLLKGKGLPSRPQCQLEKLNV